MKPKGPKVERERVLEILRLNGDRLRPSLLTRLVCESYMPPKDAVREVLSDMMDDRELIADWECMLIPKRKD